MAGSLLRQPPTETFSDFWYRVAPRRPRLSVHARFIRQRQGPGVVYVVEDPAGGSYYRMSESARYFVGMLDGRRTADEAWRACLAQLGDQAPTQRECLELLAQLQLFGLITGDEPIAPDMLAERHDRFRRQRLRARTGNWMFFSIPLVNPEPLLRRLEPLLRPMWGWPGLVALLGLTAAALVQLVTNAHKLGGDFNHVLSPANLPWLGAIFLLIRLVHELGHAAACKAMGGRCTEIGVMLIAYVLPLPYCDTTSSWRLAETHRRVIVAMGGVLVELVLAAAAALVWAQSEPGLVRTLAFNVMFISGVTTFVFNLNPLLRYDGYYVLMDLAGSPNLASRAKELWKHLVLSRVFGVLGARPPQVRDAAELRLLLVYHVLAVPYRLTVLASILTLILGRYLTVGLVLAVVFGFVWLLMPAIGAAWYLCTHPQLVGRRGRALGLSAGALSLLLALGAWLPLPASSTVPAIVDWTGLAPVRAGASGYLERIEAVIGGPVGQDQTIFVLRNDALAGERAAAQARHRRALAVLDESAAQGTMHRRVAEADLARARHEMDEAQQVESALIIRAPVSGRLVSPRAAALELEQAVGRFVRKGEILAFVLPETGPSVLAAVPDDQVPLLLEGSMPTRATVRLRGAAGRSLRAEVTRVWPSGTRELPTEALAASAGGEILQDPTNPGRALHPLTQIELRPDAAEGLLYGRRGRVRFELEPEPLLPRISRAVRRLIEGRLSR